VKGRRPRGNDEDARIFFLKSKPNELVRGFLYLCSLLFFAPESTKSLTLSLFSLAACVSAPLGVCVCICRGARSSRETEYKLKSRLFFFLFFSWRKDAFSVSLSKQSRGRKGTEQNRERDLAKNNGFKHTNRQIELTQLNFHNNKQQEEKKYTKQTTFLLDALFFQRLENVLFHLVVSL